MNSQANNLPGGFAVFSVILHFSGIGITPLPLQLPNQELREWS